MKKDLVKNMTASIGTLEKEVMKIRSEQSRLESVGKTSESEQKRIDQSLAHSAELLKSYKTQWDKQLDHQAITVKDLVQTSVSEALKQRKADQELELKREVEAQKKFETQTKASMQGSW